MMDWLTNQNPFFRAEHDAAAYLTSELPLVVPAGWEVERSSEEHLSWTITKSGQWMENYRVEVSSGLDFLIFFYGNNDHGGFGLHHVLHMALVIEARALRGYSLGECVNRLFDGYYRPNLFGRT
jgi:hypothetical protein